MDGNHNKDGDLQAAPLSDGREGIDTRTPAQIIVLGMHRSGTSAMTGALHRMGVFVGDEEALTGKNGKTPLVFSSAVMLGRYAIVSCTDRTPIGGRSQILTLSVFRTRCCRGNWRK